MNFVNIFFTDRQKTGNSLAFSLKYHAKCIDPVKTPIRKDCMMPKINRRRFIAGSSALTLATFFPAPAFLGANESKNDRLLIGCIGVGGQGTGDSKNAARYGTIVAVADADLRHAEAAKAAFGTEPDVYQDYRKLLERQDVDVIIQGTPDHWHTKVNIDACLAGKDIYAEKPLTLTIDEGKQLCKVVRETKRVLQTGTQQRSDRGFQTAVELVRNGRIGKLKQVWVALPFYSTKGGPFFKEEVPAELDWDLYQGQAPVHDYNVHRTHSIFRWWYEYAGGVMTDWGNHHMDIAHWGMDCELSGPLSVEARGLFPNEGRKDCYNTPDRFFSRMIYPGDVELLFFASFNQRATYGDVEKNVDTGERDVDWLFGEGVPEEIKTYDRDGIMFIGDKGQRVFVNRGGVYGKPVEELEDKPFESGDWRAKRSTNHMRNFFDCVRSRETPVAPVDIEHRSVSACHLTNISIQLGGQKLRWDAEKEEFIDNAEANAMLKREQRVPYNI